MPEITVSMAFGRTDEQKAGMMRDITQALVKNLGVDADAVVIQINEQRFVRSIERLDLGFRGHVFETSVATIPEQVSTTLSPDDEEIEPAIVVIVRERCVRCAAR